MKREPWKDSASCRTDDAHLHDLFFPPSNGETNEARLERQRIAFQICEECPVALYCEAYAHRFRMENGIWNGIEGAELMRQRRHQEATGIRDRAVAAV